MGACCRSVADGNKQHIAISLEPAVRMRRAEEARAGNICGSRFSGHREMNQLSSTTLADSSV